MSTILVRRFSALSSRAAVAAREAIAETSDDSLKLTAAPPYGPLC